MVSTLIANQKKSKKKKNNGNAAKCRTKRRDEVIKARWEERAETLGTEINVISTLARFRFRFPTYC